MDVVQPVQQHLHHLLDLGQRELHVGVAQQAGQVVLTEVKDQVDAAFVPVELRGFRTKTIRTKTNVIIKSEDK